MSSKTETETNHSTECVTCANCEEEVMKWWVEDEDCFCVKCKTSCDGCDDEECEQCKEDEEEEEEEEEHYCEEDDCEQCRRGKYCDCWSKTCPYCGPKM